MKTAAVVAAALCFVLGLWLGVQRSRIDTGLGEVRESAVSRFHGPRHPSGPKVSA